MWPKIDIVTAVSTFYLLEEMSLFEPPWLIAGARFKRDLGEYKDRFTRQFARAIFDYIVISCAREALHADNGCRFAGDIMVGLPYGKGGEFNFNPQSLLRFFAQLFRLGGWLHRYGGEPWACIAESGLMYGNIPDAIFIDHCIDLAHNTSNMFNKEYNMKGFYEFSEHWNFIRLLDIKANDGIASWCGFYYDVTLVDTLGDPCRPGPKVLMTPQCYRLLERARVLGFSFKSNPVAIKARFEEPVKWGKQIAKIPKEWRNHDEKAAQKTI